MSIVSAAPVIPVALSHLPAPDPSDVHIWPLVPAEVIKYSLFSTLVADNVPSARSVRSSSAGCFASNWDCTDEVTPSRYPNSVLVTSDTSIFPSALEIIALDASRSSLSIVDPAPVKVPGSPQVPAPTPSEVQTCPFVPSEVIAYCTLLADNSPSARSARSAS